jgi:glycosyltransferase involved in cell wall biosynthesis
MLNNGYRDDEITVIRNGVDTDYFHPIPPDKELKEKYKIGGDDMVFVSVAGTGLHKGWQLLVEAVSKLDNKLKNKIKIILAGAIPNERVREKYIEKLNMNEQVIFTGLLPDVRKVISIADVGFVLSYKIETISFACREMMSMGKAVLVSDFAGLPENVDDGINGWLAKCLNVDSIYEKVNEIIRNIDKLDQFSVEARKKAEKEFGLKEFIDKTYLCYESTLMSAKEVS